MYKKHVKFCRFQWYRPVAGNAARERPVEREEGGRGRSGRSGTGHDEPTMTREERRTDLEIEAERRADGHHAGQTTIGFPHCHLICFTSLNDRFRRCIIYYHTQILIIDIMLFACFVWA